VATAVDLVIFFALALTLFPALTPEDPVVKLVNMFGTVEVPDISVDLRSRNYVIDKCISFVFSNLTAYLANIYFVFQPGRHQRHVEIALFYIVSIVAMVAGTGLGWMLIEFFRVETTFSRVGDMIAAVLINFFCRKFLIFRG
jgi:putative flippase GtrA